MPRLVKDYALYVHLTYKDDDLFRNGENLQNEQSSCSFSRDKQISHYEFVLQKQCDYWLENQTLILRSVPQMLKKMKNRRKQNFEGEAKHMQLDKEDTRRSN